MTFAAILTFAAASGAHAQDAQDVVDPMSGIDWSVALRGSYDANTLTGGQASMSLAPDVSLTLGGERTLSRLAAGSVLTIDSAGQARVSDLHAGGEGTYRLDSLTTLDGSVNASLTQGKPTDTNLPANTLAAPLVVEGTVEGNATRDFDRIDLKATVEGARYAKGPTTLGDLTTVDNAADSYWSGGATLRASYEITPLIAAFVEGEGSVKVFDAPSPTLLKFLDGRTYQLRAGVSYVQGSIIAAEASIGHAWLDYFDSSLADAPGWVYNASVTFNPDETLSLVGSFNTTLGPSSTAPGDTEIAYAANASARYQINPWLTLRSSAGWDQAVTLGSNGVSWGYEAGLGLDYRSSRHIVWSADYLYARDYEPPTPLNDTHTVTVGVRVQR